MRKFRSRIILHLAHTILMPGFHLLVNSIKERANLARVHDDDDDDPGTEEIRSVLLAALILMLSTPFFGCLLIPINITFSDWTPFILLRADCCVMLEQ